MGQAVVVAARSGVAVLRAVADELAVDDGPRDDLDGYRYALQSNQQEVVSEGMQQQYGSPVAADQWGGGGTLTATEMA